MWNNNNPVDYSDPSGYCAEDACVVEGSAGIAVAGALGFLLSNLGFKSQGDALSGFSKGIQDKVNGAVSAAVSKASSAIAGSFAKASGNEEKKVPKAGVSGKEGSKDIPSWAKGERPNKDEDGKAFATRLLDEKYGTGNYDKGAGSDFSSLQKYGDRSFENPPLPKK
jgi:hypothetical protein